MKLANLEGRVHLVTNSGYVDIASASGDRFGPDPLSVIENWSEVAKWAEGQDGLEGKAAEGSDLGAPVPNPRQVFAIGLNYRGHAKEAGFDLPETPPTFTKYVSCLTGPGGQVTLPSDNVDWEVELVAVVGKEATNVAAEDGWSHIAGLMIGQDLSERVVQRSGPAPQFSLGKSFPKFGPTGPHLVGLEDISDPSDLAIGCTINGETVQDGRTNDLIFTVPELVAYLSSICTLYPGDLIFTGTPSGVGAARTPARFLAPGEVLESTIQELGTMRHELVSADSTKE